MGNHEDGDSANPAFSRGQRAAEQLLAKDPDVQEILEVLLTCGQAYNCACDRLRAKLEEHDVPFPQEVATAIIHLAAASASTINFQPKEKLGRMKQVVMPFMEKLVEESEKDSE